MKIIFYNDIQYSEGEKSMHADNVMLSFERFYQKSVIVKEVNKDNQGEFSVFKAVDTVKLTI